ncbi:hypothetical protein AAG570_009453 [Ranatra chinensis]|uniref:NADP-dependent oxidoreductase domain-containing protein n=1 Tax=Ranatra chinensis TaxID=642074 RepID=A0ABD0YZZ9_9HEMI
MPVIGCEDNSVCGVELTTSNLIFFVVNSLFLHTILLFLFTVGTYTIRGRETIFKVIDAALKLGYRSFDTAAGYGNEQDIGLALKEFLPKYNLKREHIFITSKLAPKDQGEGKVRAAVKNSLSNLGLDYLDLYLIHWPGTSGLPVESSENSILRRESWEGLEEFFKEGSLRSIGVSNYTARHMKELIESSSVVPAVNQVEFHPHYDHPNELYNICADSRTLLQAYSSLGGNGVKTVLDDSTVIKIAQKISKQPAQILLRWALQRGYGIIPKSVNPERIKINSEIDFTLEDNDMESLNSIEHRQKYSWNPDNVA